MNKRDYMLKTPLYKLIPAMALPTIASMLVTSIYNLADTFFVSTLGTYATGAVGVNMSIDNIIMMAGSFLSMGASSYISRLLGARNDKKAAQTLATTFFTAFFTGLFVLIVGYAFMDPLVRVLGATDEVVSYAKDYAGYVLLAAPFMAATFVLNQCLRAEGNAALAMVGTLFGAVLNIALDPLFIFVLDLGVKGASAATAISKLVSFCILLSPYLRKRTTLRLSIRNVCYSRDIVSEVLKMGSPALLRNGLSTLAAILLNNLAGGYSASALAAISVVNRVVMFMTAICLGIGQGFQPVAGFCWGARHYKRIREAYLFTGVAGTAFITVLALLVAVFAKPILLLFTEADQDLVTIGVFSLRVQCLAAPFHCWVIVVNMLCSAIGKAGNAAFLGVSRQGTCFLPILPVMTWLFGVWGVAAVQGVADVLSVIPAVPISLKVMREVRRLAAENPSEEEEQAETLPAT